MDLYCIREKIDKLHTYMYYFIYCFSPGTELCTN